LLLKSSFKMNIIRYFLALFCAIMLFNGVGLGQSIQISTTNAFFCSEGTISVNYATTGLFSNDNVFTAQLSDSSGQFNLPVIIGSSPGNSSGMIQAQMPNNLFASGNYKVRVVASNPNIVSANVINAPIQNTILDTWVRRADVGTIPKSYGTGFAIENKLYFGTGANANYTTNDFWEYNPTSNVWTRKQNLPIVKSASVGFSIGNKGYVCGGNGQADLWEYNPQLNTWSQKANLGGVGRSLASAFVIDGIGYVGLGKGSSGALLNDLWAYNQGSNTWSQKSNFPGGARYAAVGLAINNKGYFGLGLSGSSYKKDFWEYNPQSNSWTQKSNFIGSPRQAATAFAIQNKGYVGLGYQASNKRDFFEYNQQTDTWQQLGNFMGTARRSSTALSIGNKAFIISGISNSGSTNDLWEYSASTQLIQIDSVQRIICRGTSLPISYKVGCNNFASDNVFNVQLSDTTGSFEYLQTIGTLNAIGSGIINVYIAPNALFSKRYLVRIVASSPQSVSSSFSISILPQNTVQLTSTIGSNFQNVCIGSPISPITYSVYGISNIQADSLPFGVSANLTNNTITLSGSTSSVRDNNYAIKLLGGCVASTVTGSISVKPLTSIVTQPSNSRQQICQFSDANPLRVVANGFNLTYQWFASNDSSNQTGTSISGANSNVLSPPTNLVNTKYYYCFVNGSCGLPIVSKVSGRHKITESGSWLGLNQNWNDSQNWCGGVPQTTENAIIPSGSTNYPVVSNAEASCHNLIVNAGATLELNNQTLNISGTINNFGTINAIDGSINLNGSTPQTITPSNFFKNKIKNLKISNTNVVSIIGVNDTLKLSGNLSFGNSNCTLQTNNNIAIISDSIKTGNISDMTSDGVNSGVYSGNKIIGNVTIERYVPNRVKAWQFLSTPTSGQTIKAAWQEGNATLVNDKPGYGTTLVSNLPNALSPSLGFDFYSPNGSTIKTYNSTTNTWEGVSSTFNSINNPKGYALYVRGDRSVTAYNQPATSTILRTSGVIYQPINPPPTVYVAANKFESVGNPYASAIDLTKLTRTGGVQDVYYVWDPKLAPTYYGGGYRTLVRIGEGYVAVPSDDNSSSYYNASNQNINIQSGQAFFVRADSALGDGTLSFNENCKVKDDAIVTRTTAELVKKISVNLNRETTSGPVLLDGVISLFDDTYQNELNYSDASKLFIGSSEGLAIIRNNKTLAAEKRALPQVVDTIFYKLNQLKNLQYNLSIKFENFEDSILKPYLVDRYTGAQQMLLFNSSNLIQFAVTSDALSASPNRFYLTFKPMQTLPVKFTSITAENVSKSINKINWKVENEINIVHYDIEKSIDGRSFLSIGNQASMYNNGQSGAYQFVDSFFSSDVVFYRVKSIDLDGSHSYSNIVRLSDLGNKNKLYVSPNPVENKIINLYFKNQPKGQYVVSIVDAKGQQLKSTQYTLTETDKAIKISAKEILHAGAYFLKIDGPDNSKSVIPVVIQ
jgi:N-acetylneuraminic acid mutarotase